MSGQHTSPEPLRPVSALLLTLGLLVGCGDQTSPLSPTGTARDQRNVSIMVSGHVYQRASSVGEPPLADVLITLRDARGAEGTAKSDHRGFYSIQATPGDVVITAAKEGYSTSESRFDAARSTVLNFGLEPLLP
jgi:hypothetical protein